MANNTRGNRCRDQGFTLIEVLIAVAVVTTGLMSVAQLTMLTSRANDVARDAGSKTVLAAQKLDQLQSSPAGSLVPTPADAAFHAAAGAFEYLDRAGQPIAEAGEPPGSAVYVRRWSIRPLTGVADPRAVGIAVSVTRVRRLTSGTLADATPFDAVRLSAIQSGLAP